MPSFETVYLCESKIDTLCGIVGIWSKNKIDNIELKKLESAIISLKHRGPDNQSIKSYSNCAFGHCRLSIIDLSENANQPFSDPSNRYHLVFNGEIYNYKELRSKLEVDGVNFVTDSDTEVVLHYLIEYGVSGIQDFNGFFAFSFYDELQDELLLVRDRLGIKPLLYLYFNNKLIFSSELNQLIAFIDRPELDRRALNYYFSLTYIPAEFSILENIRKLQPGELIKISKGSFKKERYYLPKKSINRSITYENAKVELRKKIEQAVERRLISDVPLGSFLSGGLDSSIIAAQSKLLKSDLKTYSVGFDDPFFNETEFALATAKKIGSDHTVFTLSKGDFEDNFDRFLYAIDEPFADSSAFAVFLLAEKTKQEVTVALSGDGADELFGGYRKHQAEWYIQNAGGIKKAFIKFGAGLLKESKESRSDRFGDLNRKLQKLSKGMKMTPEQRYFEFCSFIPEEERFNLLNSYQVNDFRAFDLKIDSLNDYLVADQRFVLPNDMLKKVDLMSMAHSLEVRTPFLDHELVDFANSLRDDYKINKNGGKRILAETYRDILPDMVLNRSKKGFEIPIKSWLGDKLFEHLSSPIFSKEYLKEQGIFKPESVKKLVNSWNDPKFGDRIYSVWALIVFQNWFDRNLRND